MTCCEQEESVMESKFTWSVRISRMFLQFIHRDIFEKPKRSSLRLLILLIFYIVMLYGGFYTIYHRDAETAFNAAVVLGGAIQVGSH